MESINEEVPRYLTVLRDHFFDDSLLSFEPADFSYVLNGVVKEDVAQRMAGDLWSESCRERFQFDFSVDVPDQVAEGFQKEFEDIVSGVIRHQGSRMNAVSQIRLTVKMDDIHIGTRLLGRMKLKTRMNSIPIEDL